MKYNRAEFRLEECHNRRIVKGDLDLTESTEGELNYLDQIAGLWAKSSHKAIRAVGVTLAVTVDAERARREWQWNLEQAKFDAIAAEERPPLLPTGPMDDLPKWSEVSQSDDFPEIPEHE